MKWEYLSLLIITFFIFYYCNCSSTSPIDGKAEKAVIMAIYKDRLEKIQSVEILQEKVDAYLAPLAEDAVWMPPNSPKIYGKTAIWKWAEIFFKNYTLKVDSIPENYLEIGNQIAIRTWRSVGKYISNNDGTVFPYDQKYIDYFRRDNDGNWKYVAHMWSSNNTKPDIWH